MSALRERGQVSDAEVDRWVQVVKDFVVVEDLRDINGGVAPQTIIDVLDSPRHPQTVRRHLRDDNRVESRFGVGRSHQHKPRDSFVPASGTPPDERLSLLEAAAHAPDDLPACRLSVHDAIEQCPAERQRVRELLREAAQLLEADP
jgi:hypothetical protein